MKGPLKGKKHTVGSSSCFVCNCLACYFFEADGLFWCHVAKASESPNGWKSGGAAEWGSCGWRSGNPRLPLGREQSRRLRHHAKRHCRPWGQAVTSLFPVMSVSLQFTPGRASLWVAERTRLSIPETSHRRLPSASINHFAEPSWSPVWKGLAHFT